MHSFEVHGGKKLKGEITPQGAKNEALQIISAVLLTPEKVSISNIPNILDVNLLIELLSDMNVKVDRLSKDSCIFQADDVNVDYLHSETFRKKSGRLRGSVMLAGPMLSRFRKAFIPKPGGDKIGRRRLDTHIINFEKLGAEFTYHEEDGFFHLEAPNLKGANLLLDEPSVTGTANIVMAATMAKGTTTIYNAACEPYIQQLCRMLISMGAKITGVGSNMLSIEGVKYIGGTMHSMLPDMIEVGSFIGLAAMTQSDIVIKNAGIDHLGIIPEKFQQLGIQMNFVGDDIHIPEQDKYEDARHDAVEAIPFDESRIRTAMQQLAEVQTELAVHQARLQSDVYNVLTPEQQQQAQKLRAERQARVRERQERLQQRLQQRGARPQA